MKKQFAAICTSVVIGLGAVSAWAENPFMEKLPFEQATIHYEVSGMEKGKETLYIDGYGEKSAMYRETSSSMMGMTIQNRTVEISDGQWDYSFDLEEGVGTKVGNPMYYMQQEYEQLGEADQELIKKNRKMMGMNVMAGLGGQVEENVSQLLGYDCDKVEAMGTLVYTIHGSSIPLKSETDMMGMKMSSVATEVATGDIESKYFAFPAGIEPEFDAQADAMSKNMAAQTIAWLKDPEAVAQPSPAGEAMGQDRMQHIPEGDQGDMMKQLEQMQEMMKGMQGMMPGAAGN